MWACSVFPSVRSALAVLLLLRRCCCCSSHCSVLRSVVVRCCHSLFCPVPLMVSPPALLCSCAVPRCSCCCSGWLALGDSLSPGCGPFPFLSAARFVLLRCILSRPCVVRVFAVRWSSSATAAPIILARACPAAAVALLILLIYRYLMPPPPSRSLNLSSEPVS